MNEITILFIAIIGFQLLSFAATWRLFKLAGEASWKAAVPVYAQLTMLKIIERPWWWVFFLFLPVIAPVMLLVIYADFLRTYNKRSFVDILLTLVLGLIYVGYINYKKDTEFVGVEERKETLVASLMFAVILATTIHTYIIQPMIIPTGSMENTLRIGDALFVEKLSYGSRVPFTPVAIPFADLFLRRKPSAGAKEKEGFQDNYGRYGYLKELQMPYLRLPGWRDLKRNDIVVFNYPTDSIYEPIDRKDPYVKRLVGLPGDTLAIDDGILKINGKDFQPKKDAIVQYSYNVEVKGNISRKQLEEDYELIYTKGSGTDYFGKAQMPNGNSLYQFMALSDAHVKKLKKNPNVVSVNKIIQPKNQRFDFSYNRPNTKTDNFSESDSANLLFPLLKPWNQDNYGPLYIPKKGDKINLNKDNLAQYFNIVNKYEKNNVKIKNGQLFVDGQSKDSYDYEIQQDYFFMMGDNRHNSLDARFFGYVPEENIIGRPVLLWANLNNIFGFEKKHGWKWNRWFTVPNTGEPNKTSYRYIALALLAIYLGWDYFRARRKKQKKESE